MNPSTPIPPAIDPALWDAGDVAEYLKVSRSQIYKMTDRGELPCTRVGALLRFSPEVIRAWVEQGGSRR